MVPVSPVYFNLKGQIGMDISLVAEVWSQTLLNLSNLDPSILLIHELFLQTRTKVAGKVPPLLVNGIFLSEANKISSNNISEQRRRPPAPVPMTKPNTADGGGKEGREWWNDPSFPTLLSMVAGQQHFSSCLPVLSKTQRRKLDKLINYCLLLENC